MRNDVYIHIPDQPPAVSVLLDESHDRPLHEADFVVTRRLVGRHADVPGTNCRGMEVMMSIYKIWYVEDWTGDYT